MIERVPAASVWQRTPWRIDEPDVSLTDYGLALETGLFAVLLLRRPARWKRIRRWGVAFFGAATLASLAGGTDHGFMRREGREAAHDRWWTASLLAIGGSALALAGMGAELGLSGSAARRVRAFATGAMVVYARVILSGRREFRVAILAYGPAALFLLDAFVRRRIRGQHAGTVPGVSAVVLAFVATGVQQRRIGFHPLALGHNALYHVIQAGSFGLLFAALRELARMPEGGEIRR